MSLRSTTPQRLSADRCAGCTYAAVNAVASAVCGSGRLWTDGSQSVNLVITHPTGLPVEGPSFLISNLATDLDLVWSYEKRFCCEQLFRDQKSGVFQLADSGLREPQRIDRLLLVVAIADLMCSLQGYALSLTGLRHQVDPN